MYAINNLGERLREERQKQGLTLEDVAKKTYIRRRYLESLESGDYSVMPGEVYLKGFLRSYAEALGLNGWDLVEEYNRSASATATVEGEPSSGKAVEPQPNVATSAKPSSKGRMMQNPIMLPAKEKYLQNKSKQDRRLIWLAAFVVISVALYLFLVPNWVEAPGTGNSITESVAEPINAAPPIIPRIDPVVAVEPVTDVSKPLDIPVSSGDQAAAIDSAVIDQVAPVNVQIQADQDCWVEIYADGKLSFTGVILAGTERQAAGEQKVQVRLGNPEGVVILHNGQQIGDIGKEVQTRVFTQDAHYTIQDLRREEPQREKTAVLSPDQTETAGIVEQAEN